MGHKAHHKYGRGGWSGAPGSAIDNITTEEWDAVLAEIRRTPEGRRAVQGMNTMIEQIEIDAAVTRHDEQVRRYGVPMVRSPKNTGPH